jgi:signal transduction histidine kinase
MCLSCGQVGCCDESPNKHATAHAESSDHPIARSIEPGENWIWCYKDRVLMYPTQEEKENRPQSGYEPQNEYEITATEEFLRRIPLFAGLADDDLKRIYSLARPAVIAEGDTLVRQGEEGDSLFIVLTGEFEVTKRSMNADVVLSRRGPGEMVGEMSLLAGEPRQATVRALKESRVLMISRYAFEQLLSCSPSAGMMVLRMMAQRQRSTEALVAQQEKMAGLGRLTAGLAHELNNPAAAAWRSTSQLTEALTEWQQLSGKIDALELGHDALMQVSALREEIGRRANKRVELDPLARSDLESEMQEWMEDRGVEEAWDLAPVLVGLGWDAAQLEEWTSGFEEPHLAVVIPWLTRGAQCYALVNEVKLSAERISEIVKAVKSYSYLDQAPVQEVDIREGLENTLIILKHKLKTGIEVKREYAPDLPRVEAYATELNQVWTNLIDNAIDALQGSTSTDEGREFATPSGARSSSKDEGIITIRTYRDGLDRLAVEIEDNGPGIPADIQPLIFQSFFTTKEVGKGTGLGLHIAYNVIVDKHHGQISLTSEPGKTCFKVTLPLELVRE